MLTSGPNIFEFVDPRSYLLKSYEARKAKDPNFSYSVWSGELGIKSRSFLRLMMVGKRGITEASIPIFVRGLKLSPREGKYFSALVRLSRASRLSDREHYAEELAKLRSSGRKRVQILDRFQLLSSHLGPRLQVLLSLEDLQRTPESLGRVLKVPASKILELLRVLHGLGLAHEENGEWKANERDFYIVDELGNVALQSFHRKSLEEAITAIELPLESRRYLSMIAPLSQEEFNELLGRIQDFYQEILKRFNSDRAASRTLYQFNINLIPVSRPILHARASEACAPVGQSNANGGILCST